MKFKSKETIEHNKRVRKNRRYLKELRKKATKPELIVKEYLESKNYWFIFQKGFFKPFHRIVDFYIPKIGLIIEIDGGYHLKTKTKDDQKDYCWLMRCMRTTRITNDQVYSGEYKKIIDSLGLPIKKIKPKLIKVSLGKYGTTYIQYHNLPNHS